MTCKEFKQWFNDHESDEMTDEVRSHLTICDKCKQIYTLDQILETKLTNSLEQLEVPERLQRRLEQNKPGNNIWLMQSHTMRRAIGAALAIAAMLVLFLFPLASQNRSFASMDSLSQLAIADHLSHDTLGCSGSAILDLASWSQKELGYSVVKPKVPKDAILLAASKCRLGDCDTVHLMYSQGDKYFSVFVFPKDEADFSLAANRSYSLDFGKHHVTLWQSDDQIQAMVI